MEHKYKLTLSYDGTGYGGWQVQPNAISIQSLVQKALSTATRQEILLTGSGRTDAGVHALGQVAHFSLPSPADAHKLLASLNGLLPHDIRALSLQEVDPSFHARYSSIGKTYHYHIHLDRILDPFARLYRLHVLHKIDLDRLKKASLHFIGTHDFTSFANEAYRGSASRDAVRTLRRLDILEQDGGIRLEFEGDGFLYKMVRNIVGTLIEVGYGKLSSDQIPEILNAKDRRCAGKAAEPHGLFLVHVQYSELFM